MSVDSLIDLVLERIYRDHYAGKARQREWPASQQALTKAIARYGYECRGRGWEFEPDAIWAELMRILDTMVKNSLRIETWFPVYLESAIDRHIRLRAEELSAEAKREDRRGMDKAGSRTAAKLAGLVVADLRIGEIRQPTTVEVLDKLYRDLSTRRRKRIKAKAPPVQEQPSFL